MVATVSEPVARRITTATSQLNTSKESKSVPPQTACLVALEYFRTRDV